MTTDGQRGAAPRHGRGAFDGAVRRAREALRTVQERSTDRPARAPGRRGRRRAAGSGSP